MKLPWYVRPVATARSCTYSVALLTEPCIRADTGAFFDAGIEGSTGSSGWRGRLWPLACLLSRGRVMVYRVECRPLFRTRLVCCPPSRQSKVRFGDRLPCRGPGMVSGCGKSLRNLRCRRALQSPQAWKHGLLLVADGHGGNCPPPPSQTIRTQSAVRQRQVRCGGVEPESVGRALHTTGLFAGCMSGRWFQHDVGPFWNVVGGRWDPTFQEVCGVG